MDINSITAEEVLEQANKIFAPYTLKFAAPLSWFAVWKSMPLGEWRKSELTVSSQRARSQIILFKGQSCPSSRRCGVRSIPCPQHNRLLTRTQPCPLCHGRLRPQCFNNGFRKSCLEARSLCPQSSQTLDPSPNLRYRAPCSRQPHHPRLRILSPIRVQL